MNLCVHSFLCLVAYCSKFVPHFAAITEPLWRLTRQKADFIWTREQESTFSKIKAFISKATILSYFHPALLLMPVSKVWVLFCFKKPLQIAFFNQ